MVGKIKAAVDTRRDADMVIIARTDARAVEGLQAALDRMNAYLDAGADVGFVEAPQNAQELAAIPKAFSKPALGEYFRRRQDAAAADGASSQRWAIASASTRRRRIARRSPPRKKCSRC